MEQLKFMARPAPCGIPSIKKHTIDDGTILTIFIRSYYRNVYRSRLSSLCHRTIIDPLAEAVLKWDNEKDMSIRDLVRGRVYSKLGWKRNVIGIIR